MKFTVLLSVYYKENHIFFKESIESILCNTLKPSQVIIVKDGQLTIELENVIEFYVKNYEGIFTIVELEKNVGLGNALNIGLGYAIYDLVARMDTDDICKINRFERQVRYLEPNMNISVVGSSLDEFNKVPGDLDQARVLPENNDDLIKFAKFRNPLNHPTVMFRKKDILQVGSYMDMISFEDYYLWVRLLNKGYKIANIKESLLYFRVGNDMIGRRRGSDYVKNELKFLRTLQNIGFISKRDFLFSLITKIPLRLLPKKVLVMIYKRILR